MAPKKRIMGSSKQGDRTIKAYGKTTNTGKISHMFDEKPTTSGKKSGRTRVSSVGPGMASRSREDSSVKKMKKPPSAVLQSFCVQGERSDMNGDLSDDEQYGFNNKTQKTAWENHNSGKLSLSAKHTKETKLLQIKDLKWKFSPFHFPGKRIPDLQVHLMLFQQGKQVGNIQKAKQTSTVENLVAFSKLKTTIKKDCPTTLSLCVCSTKTILRKLDKRIAYVNIQLDTFDEEWSHAEHDLHPYKEGELGQNPRDTKPATVDRVKSVTGRQTTSGKKSSMRVAVANTCEKKESKPFFKENHQSNRNGFFENSQQNLIITYISENELSNYGICRDKCAEDKQQKQGTSSNHTEIIKASGANTTDDESHRSLGKKRLATRQETQSGKSGGPDIRNRGNVDGNSRGSSHRSQQTEQKMRPESQNMTRRHTHQQAEEVESLMNDKERPYYQHQQTGPKTKKAQNDCIDKNGNVNRLHENKDANKGFDMQPWQTEQNTSKEQAKNVTYIQCHQKEADSSRALEIQDKQRGTLHENDNRNCGNNNVSIGSSLQQQDTKQNTLGRDSKHVTTLRVRPNIDNNSKVSKTDEACWLNHKVETELKASDVDESYNMNSTKRTPRSQYIESRDNRSNLVVHRTGIRNLGNTCYANSILQVLGKTPRLSECLGGSCTGSVSLLKTIVDELNTNKSEVNSKNVRQLFRYVFKRDDSFRLGHQDDSHAFLLSLLDCVNNDSGDNACRLFNGKMMARFKYSTCNHVEYSQEQLFNSLLMPIDNTHTLDECIKAFCDEETFPENVLSCRVCLDAKSDTVAYKRIVFTKLPEVLVLQMGRFEEHGRAIRKRSTRIRFKEIIHLNQEKIEESGKNADSNKTEHSYRLYGVVNHFGSMAGGHYTANVKVEQTRTWYSCSDSFVNQDFSPAEKLNGGAYLLFYHLMSVR